MSVGLRFVDKSLEWLMPWYRNKIEYQGKIYNCALECYDQLKTTEYDVIAMIVALEQNFIQNAVLRDKLLGLGILSLLFDDDLDAFWFQDKTKRNKLYQYNTYATVLYTVRGKIRDRVLREEFKFDYNMGKFYLIPKYCFVTYKDPVTGEACHEETCVIQPDPTYRKCTHRGSIIDIPSREVFQEPTDVLLNPHYED